jgi:hypothetical protein
MKNLIIIIATFLTFTVNAQIQKTFNYKKESVDNLIFIYQRFTSNSDTLFILEIKDKNTFKSITIFDINELQINLLSTLVSYENNELIIKEGFGYDIHINPKSIDILSIENKSNIISINPLNLEKIVKYLFKEGTNKNIGVPKSNISFEKFNNKN